MRWFWNLSVCLLDSCPGIDLQPATIPPILLILSLCSFNVKHLQVKTRLLEHPSFHECIFQISLATLAPREPHSCLILVKLGPWRDSFSMLNIWLHWELKHGVCIHYLSYIFLTICPESYVAENSRAGRKTKLSSLKESCIF